jgi:hypothetical protein
VYVCISSIIFHSHLALLLLESVQNAINHLLLETRVDVRGAQISHNLLDLRAVVLAFSAYGRVCVRMHAGQGVRIW